MSPRWALIGTALFCFAPSPAQGATELKRVLILNPFVRDTEPFAAAGSAFRSSLGREIGGALDIYEIPLDLARFYGPAGEEPLVAFLEQRLREKPVDLVVPIGGASVQFAHRHRERLFPETQIMILAAEPRMVPEGFLAHNVTMVTQRIDLPGVIGDLLKIQPDTRQIAVVMGSSPLEKAWIEQCRREFAPFADRVEFLWLTDLPFDEILESCAALPPKTFVFHGLFLMDAGETPFEKSEALLRLLESANSPVFSLFSSEFGHGSVGGRLYQNTELGITGAGVAARILRGERAGEIPPVILDMVTPVYDWRALRRWKISEARLPAGSIVKFRQPGFWEHYRWQAMGAILFIVLQGALIVGLLVNRTRRIRAEAEATLIAEISSKFVNLPASEVDKEIIDAERRVCELLDLDVAGLWQWTEETESSLTLTHLHGEVKLPPPDEMKATDFFPWFQQAMAAGRVLGFTSLEKLPPEAARDRESFRAFGIRSCLTLPLSVGGEPPIGALALNTTRKERPWPDEQIARLQMIAQIFTNALARKRAETARRESQLRLSLAAEAAEAGMWVLDWDTQIFWITERAREIFGYPPDVIMDMAKFEQSVHPEDLGLIHPVIDHSVKTGEPLHVEYRIRREDGEARWVASHGRPLFKTNGQPERLLGLSMDITTRRDSELESRELRDELAHSGRVSLLGQLASSIAHELSQPLGAILRNAEAAEILLQSDPPDLGELRAIVTDILADDHRAGQVIDRLRSLLKRRSLDLLPLDLDEVVGEVLAMVHTDAANRDVRLIWSPAQDLPPVLGDRVHLQQVLLNLLVNAMDALETVAPENRLIELAARKSDPFTVEINVIDNGPGIPPDKIGKVLEPFFTTKADGMGMGLAVSKTIVEAHHGKLWVENAAGGGASFKFTLRVQ
jgi:PAS domain S-box-containing protein